MRERQGLNFQLAYQISSAFIRCAAGLGFPWIKLASALAGSALVVVKRPAAKLGENEDSRELKPFRRVPQASSSVPRQNSDAIMRGEVVAHSQLGVPGTKFTSALTGSAISGVKRPSTKQGCGKSTPELKPEVP